MTDIEERAQIEPLDELLAERSDLIEQVAGLRAKYGPGGLFDALRKLELSTISSYARAVAAKDGIKVTEAFLDEQAHASERYAGSLAEATQERIRWITTEAKIDAIDARIFRGQALARFAASELHLQI